MPSFDIVIETDNVELKNAVDQANKEISNRYDFKGSDAEVSMQEGLVTLHADDEFKINQVYDIVIGKMTKRGLDLRGQIKGNIEKVGGDKVKQAIQIACGIDKDVAKKIVKSIKDRKFKAQGAIQGDMVRITSGKRDTLQEVMAMLKNEMKELPLQFKNFRD